MSADWVMVIITAIYVVATIMIMCANRKAAKAAKDQLTEMKRQFTETKRLEILPYFEMDVSVGGVDGFEDDESDEQGPLFCIPKRESLNAAEHWILIDYTITLKNIGIGTAKDLSYTCQYLDKEEKRGTLDFYACASGADKSFCFRIFFVEKEADEIPVNLTFYYSDLLENVYEVDFNLKFSVKQKWKNSWDVRLIEKTISKPIQIKKHPD